MEEKKLMTIYVTKKQFDEIIDTYGKEILPPDEVLNGPPASTVQKRSPIGISLITRK